MDYNVLDALAMITREKNIDRQIVLESLVAGLQSAARKKLGADAVIDARVDESTGEMTVEHVKVVVDNLMDEDAEIMLEEAREEFGDEVQVGDELRWELPLEEFGRNAILVAKQILVQKVREAERTNIFETYKDRVNEIITGTVQQVDRGNVLVNLGRVEAMLPWREQIRGEKSHQGSTIRALIIEVLDSAKGPQIILSRSHPEFLRILFAQEVPEIQEGIVEIKAVAREPGTRSKIAVVSHDDRVDAVGSCVGMKGSRVQAVTRELAGERIDIVPWSAEPSLLISRALSPAEVNTIILRDDLHEATVVVNDDQLSKAIGKEGKNVRLAAKLTEWKIDLVSSREYHIRQRVRQEVWMELSEMTGMTDELAAALRGAGITSIEHLVNTPLDELEELAGLGEEKAIELFNTANATLDELERIIDTTVAEELAELEANERPLIDESMLGDGAPADGEAAAAAAGEAPERAAAPLISGGQLFADFDAKVSELADEDGAADGGDAED
ncbi:MAG TPA: transcription termination factor NusA [Candidatus Krumholzibacteria bacterium]|nr:transcription termination factor NusA [Candidatus Krumholzibacteria bacterium]HRX50359.1 transcription termination factor NusA [Candidatus Krumholzibacteria bacterium]